MVLLSIVPAAVQKPQCCVATRSLPVVAAGTCQLQRHWFSQVILDLGRRPEARFLGKDGGQYLRDNEVCALSSNVPASIHATNVGHLSPDLARGSGVGSGLTHSLAQA